MKGDIPMIDPAMHNNIDDDTILRAAIRTKGSSGSSGMDADG